MREMEKSCWIYEVLSAKHKNWAFTPARVETAERVRGEKQGPRAPKCDY